MVQTRSNNFKSCKNSKGSRPNNFSTSAQDFPRLLLRDSRRPTGLMRVRASHPDLDSDDQALRDTHLTEWNPTLINSANLTGNGILRKPAKAPLCQTGGD